MPRGRFTSKTRSLILSPELDRCRLDTWFLFVSTPGFGPARQRALLEAFEGNLETAFKRAPSQAAQFKLTSKQLNHWQARDTPELQHCHDWLQQAGNLVLLHDDPRYPSKLRDLADPPLILFCHGDTDLLNTQQIAMVGSRNPSPAGARHARQFAQDIASRGLTVTSGLAMGIDAMAHHGCLAANGLTIAVTGTGLDRVYPASNKALAKDIAHQGLLLSEFLPGTPARKENFPRRNRLIAALAMGTLVIEAALRSGSLITARLASELGREVFAMPGSVDNPMARGCHKLIRQGAKLVETTDDILEELGPIMDNASVKRTVDAVTTRAELDPEYQHLLDAMDDAPRSIDELVEFTGMSIEAISSMLLILELQGAVASTKSGGFQKLQA
ncbi:MAG: DNA-processing protein DprA [Oceanococcus sp.]